MIYQIWLEGQPQNQSSQETASSLKLAALPNGERVLSVTVTDREALHNLLQQIAALELPLFSVAPGGSDAHISPFVCEEELTYTAFGSM